MASWLATRFSAAPLLLPAPLHLRLVEQVAAAGLRGGAIHDALIAATALHAGLGLLTLDRRALPTYATIGVAAELLE